MFFFSFAGGFFHAEKKNLPLEMVGNNCPLKVTAYSFINCRLVYAVRQAECNCSANQLLLHSLPIYFFPGPGFLLQRTPAGFDKSFLAFKSS